MPARTESSRVKTDDRPINVILLGDPAAGKATQSELLVKRYKLLDFDMGKELTRLRKKNKKIDSVLSDSSDKGNLTPTKIVRKILIETVGNVPSSIGILFDGHPKMLGEAQLVSRLLKKYRRKDPTVLYLSIPLDETIRRMSDRKGYFSGKFGKRADDTDAALKNRARYYRKNISQVVSFFKQHFKFKKVSGLGSVSQVEQRVIKALTQ